MKIGFASNDWSRSMRDKEGNFIMGGSGYIRIGQYVRHINKTEHTSVSGILAFDNNKNIFGVHTWNGQNHFDCDVIVMQRFMHKLALRDLKSARAAGQIVINDIDDWYWGLSPLNAAYKLANPTISPDENTEHYKAILANSSGVITSTPFLQEKVSRWNSNCKTHQNYVDLSTFTKRNHTDKQKPVVGWMGSTSHRSGDLQILKGVSRRISANFSWHHTGHIEAPNVPKFWDEIKVEAGNVTRTNFMPPDELDNGIKFDIGIVPLTNIPFNDAKSWIKGLEYAAAGIPFIASPSAEYKRLKSEYGIGIIAKRDSDFLKHIESLKDHKVRQEIADQNYNNVKKLDISVGTPLLIKTIEDLANEAR